MKREFLTKLLPDAPKEVIDQIMNENEKDIEAQKNTISTLTTERDGLKTQLDTAQAEIRSYKDMDIDGNPTEEDIGKVLIATGRCAAEWTSVKNVMEVPI